MEKRSTLLAFAAGLLSLTTLNAQIAFGGEPLGLRSPNNLTTPTEVLMPEVDAAPLLAEDAERMRQGMKGPYRFGVNHATNISLCSDGVWDELPNGDRVWRVAIKCPGAFSINFEFHDYSVPEGGQVFVYNDLGEHLGAFNMESSAGHPSMGVTQLPGDRITIEYIEPAAMRGQGRLKVGQVTHGYRDIFGMMKGLNDSGTCNNNVICPEGDPWRAQIRSVAMMTVGGSGFCTGQLINNCANDGTPYFLTANHCLGGSMTNWVFRFNWDSPTCSPTQNAPTNKTVTGATLKATNSGSDMALLQLNSTPPESYNVFYTGWDKSGVAPTASTAIHHPSGDIKKISFDDDNAGTASVNLGNGSATCWRIFNWEDGTTEGGSSGSGLWNQNGLLIGQLYGGQASCSTNINDYYGKFSLSFPAIQQWLGDCGDQLQGWPLVTSVAETPGHDRMLVAPNPTTGDINVVLPSTMLQGARVVLYDALGQVVLERVVARGIERFDMDLGGRTEGIYLLEVVSDTQRVVERIVLSR